MKKILILIFAASLIALSARGQTPVSVITMVGANPTFSPSGSLLTCSVQSLWQTSVTVAGQTYTSQSSVSWDGTSTTNSVTVGNITVTYAQATALITAIATQERAQAPGTQAAAAASKPQ